MLKYILLSLRGLKQRIKKAYSVNKNILTIWLSIKRQVNNAFSNLPESFEGYVRYIEWYVQAGKQKYHYFCIDKWSIISSVNQPMKFISTDKLS